MRNVTIICAVLLICSTAQAALPKCAEGVHGVLAWGTADNSIVSVDISGGEWFITTKGVTICTSPDKLWPDFKGKYKGYKDDGFLRPGVCVAGEGCLDYMTATNNTAFYHYNQKEDGTDIVEGIIELMKELGFYNFTVHTSSD